MILCYSELVCHLFSFYAAKNMLLSFHVAVDLLFFQLHFENNILMIHNIFSDLFCKKLVSTKFSSNFWLNAVSVCCHERLVICRLKNKMFTLK
jgi:hypothetical protein